MAAGTVTPPSGYALDSATPAAPPSSSGTPKPPAGYSLGETPDLTDPAISGELINDVGNKVIVPKDGEEFGDTIKRAIAYHHSLTPEQRKAAIDKETATMPKKTGETLAGAASIGFLGPALMAAPGEALMETHALLSAGFKALVPAVTSGVVGIGQWAEAHPVAAKAVWEVLKTALAGTIAGKVAKSAGRVINANPD